MTIPTIGETYFKLNEHITKAQEAAAMLAHLHNAEGRTKMGIMWLAVSENFRKSQYKLQELIESKLQ